MSIVLHPSINFPVEREVKAAIEGKRALAAYLATQFETQHIQIFDEQNQAHQVELPTSALQLLMDILAALAEGNTVIRNCEIVIDLFVIAVISLSARGLHLARKFP